VTLYNVLWLTLALRNVTIFRNYAHPVRTSVTLYVFWLAPWPYEMLQFLEIRHTLYARL